MFDKYFDRYNIRDSDGNKLDYLVQWDMNRSIVIDNSFGISEPPTFHFCNSKSKEALVVISEIKGSEICVKIPNRILQEPFPVFMYVYTHDMDATMPEDKTIAAIRIELKPRVKPSDYLYVENVDKITADRLENMIKEKLAELEEKYNSAIDGIDEKIDDVKDDLNTEFNQLSESANNKVNKAIEELRNSLRYLLVPYYNESLLAIEFEAYEVQGEGGGSGRYILPTASRTRLGGVKVGDNIEVNEDGVISSDSAEITSSEVEAIYNNIIK